jgi:hypothetical protein
LFSAGRISYPALQERQRWKLRAFLERDKPTMCSLSFSLVPSNVTGLEGENEGVRGQWLIMTIKYTCEATFSAVDMNAVRFMFADSEGGDDLERPPNGHATEAALAACLRLIPELTDEVWRIAPFVSSLNFVRKRWFTQTGSGQTYRERLTEKGVSHRWVLTSGGTPTIERRKAASESCSSAKV